MAYTQLEWTATTPMSAINMNHMEEQYDDAVAEQVTHAALDTGTHGAGGAALVTDADITTHANTFTGVHGRVSVGKPDDEIVNNSNILQNDDDLYFAVAANENWIFLLGLKHTVASGVGSGGTDIAFSIPAAGSIVRLPTAFETNEVGVDATIEEDLIVDGTYYYMNWYLYIGAGNAGNVQLQWAQVDAHVSNNTLHEGSFITGYKIS